MLINFVKFPGEMRADPNMADRWAVWPTHGEPWEGWVLGPEVIAVWTHWAEGRSQLCPGEATCGRCAEGVRKRAQYHALCWDARLRHKVVLILGAKAVRGVLEVASEFGHLRGLRLRITKLGASNRSNYAVLPLADDGFRDNLPSGGGLYEMMAALYGVETLPMYTQRGV